MTQSKHADDIDKAIKTCQRNYVFELNHLPLDKEDFKYLARKMEDFSEDFLFQIVKLRNCNVGEKFLRNLLEIQRKITELDLSANTELPVAVLTQVLENPSTKSIDLSDCALSANDLTILADAQVKSLKLNFKSFICTSISTQLGHLLKRQLKSLELIDSPISTADLKILANVSEIQLENLDLSHVPLNEEGMEAVAEIVNNTEGMQRLGLSDCEIKTKGLAKFCGTVSKKVNELDLSYNDLIDSDGDRVVSSTARKCQTKILDISGRKLTGSNIRQLRSVRTKISDVNLSENAEIDASEAGKLASEWKLETLSLSECRLEAGDLTEFQESIGRHKLESLDISEPIECPTDEKIKAIVRLRDCVSKTISFRCSVLSAEQNISLHKYCPGNLIQGAEIVVEVTDSKSFEEC